jgi:hypothetical protein
MQSQPPEESAALVSPGAAPIASSQPHTASMRKSPPPFARAGLLLLLLFLASSCVVSQSGMQKQQITLKLEDQYRHVVELENLMKPESLDNVLQSERGRLRGDDEIMGTPFWYIPQYQFKSALEMAPLSAKERRQLKLKWIKKYGLGFVLFKPAPGDVNFLTLGESDPNGFTLDELHHEFGAQLPPFTSLLKICLTHPKE